MDLVEERAALARMADLELCGLYLRRGYGRRVGYTVGMSITDVTFQRGLRNGYVFPGTYNGMRYLSDDGKLGTIESVLGTFGTNGDGRFFQPCSGWYAVNINTVPAPAAQMAMAQRKAPAQMEIN